MNISYLITFSNETNSLKNLLERVYSFKDKEDEMVLLVDVNNYGEETKNVLQSFLENKTENDNIVYWERSLDNDYSSHKNWGARQCKHEWVFQIDGDECPTETLLINIKDIVQANPEIEAFWIPRINDFRGVTERHARQWGWRLSISPTYKRPLVNWPDPQCRLFRNIPEIQWVGRLHERIEGNNNYVYLPFEEDLALYHDKTIEKQVETNLGYNKRFTEKENQGFNLPK
jgi:hypothetical protein